MMGRSTAAVLAGLLALPASLGAQQLQELLIVPGAKVRITAPSAGLEREVAAVQRLSPESLVVRPMRRAPAPDIALPLDAIRKLEVSLGAKRSIRSGVIVGALAVGVAGATVGNLTWSACAAERVVGCPFYRSRAAVTAVGALAGAVVGAFLGSVVERASIREKWVEVSPEAPQALLAPLPRHRLGLGVAWPI